MATNDLVDFMNSITREIEEEYNRIQKRATEDPSTAGDQGEENWAALFRDWLPPTFQIVTKGRILGSDGSTSPQVDVIILQPEYPKYLLNKKLYLAGGVLAAFECKVTLRAEHIKKFVQNSIAIKALLPKQEGSPYKELQSPIIYGLLAHTHSWKGKKSKPQKNIETNLYKGDNEYITHPIQSPDLICVADLATWSSFKSVFIGPKNYQYNDIQSYREEIVRKYGPNGSAGSGYICCSKETENQSQDFTPIGALLAGLFNKFSKTNPSLNTLSDYFNSTKLPGLGEGLLRQWDISIYSNEIKERVETGPLSNGKPWSEWHVAID
jgi:hypothetical protein